MQVTTADGCVVEIPNYVRIGGKRYIVEMVDDVEAPLGPGDDGAAVGWTHNIKQLIRLRGGRSQAADQLRDTLLHEVIHAAVYATGAEAEERDVHAMTGVLLQALRETPALAAALLD